MGRMMQTDTAYQTPISLTEIFRNGHQWASASADLASGLLDLVMQQEFIPGADPNRGDDANHVHNRFRASWMGGNAPVDPRLEAPIESLTKPVLDLLRPLYGELEVSPPALYHCTRDYSIGWHDHLKSRAVIAIVIYLSPQVIEDEDGGAFEVAKCWRGEDGTVSHRKIVSSHVPKQGDVVIMDGMGPFWEHHAETFRADKDRYFLGVSLGSDDF